MLPAMLHLHARAELAWGEAALAHCDVPDIVVVAYAGDPTLDFFCDLPDVATPPPHCFAIHGHIHVLDGATGELLLTVAHPVSAATTPAIGDIDGDGLPEIVTIAHDSETLHDAHLVAFEHDGTLAWESTDGRRRTRRPHRSSRPCRRSPRRRNSVRPRRR